MGWDGYHLHQFIVNGVMYGNADMMEDFDLSFARIILMS